MAEDTGEDTQIIINNEVVTFTDPIYLDNGRLFAPVRQMVEYLGGEINWDPELRQIFITTALEDTLIFTIDEYEMQFNDHVYNMDVVPFIKENRTYIPIRHLAEFLHAHVSWDESTKTAAFTSVPLRTLVKGDSMIQISEEYETTTNLIEERNETTALGFRLGDQIKVVIPTIMEEKLPHPDTLIVEEIVEEPETHPDFELLAKIIQAEAGWESYEGQIAVGSVIMNRVNSERFPDSIYDVIYARGQFGPVRNGALDRAVPNESVLKATQAVLDGENNVEGALYFHNPKVSWDSFWAGLEVVDQIGNHRFVK